MYSNHFQGVRWCRPFKPEGHVRGPLGGGGRVLFWWVLWVCFALVAPNGAVGQSRHPSNQPTLPLQPCHLPGLSAEARCGVLKRPLDPSEPDGMQIELRVAVIPSTSNRRQPDPVFFLAGGPGQSAVEWAAGARQLTRPLTAQRDLVLVEQRGTGRSAPLICEEVEPTRALEQVLDLNAQARALQRCREVLQQLPHGDLRHFTTSVAAQDLEAARQALGLGPVNLVGVSYGTRLALEMLRQFPGSVRRVVLDGVAPPDMVLPYSMHADARAAWDAVVQSCEAETACRREIPQLRRQWQALLASLPRQVRVTHPRTRLEESVMLTPETLWGLIRPPLYHPAVASALPAAVQAASEGRFTPLFGLSQAGGTPVRGRSLAMGLHLSVICAEDGQDLRPGGPAAAELYRRLCAEWPRATLPEGFRTISPSPVPVLLLSGGQDPVTPPRHARRVAQALGAQALAVEVEHAGHGVLGLECLRGPLERFIRAETAERALAVKPECTRPPAAATAYRPLPLPSARP